MAMKRKSILYAGAAALGLGGLYMLWPKKHEVAPLPTGPQSNPKPPTVPLPQNSPPQGPPPPPPDQPDQNPPFDPNQFVDTSPSAGPGTPIAGTNQTIQSSGAFGTSPGQGGSSNSFDPSQFEGG